MATLDVLSKGRTFIGIGSGWLKEEFEALGIDFHQRGAITDEAIQAMRVLWRENPSTFKGKHFNFGPLKSFPKPVQKTAFRSWSAASRRRRSGARRAMATGFWPCPAEPPSPT